MESVDEEGIAAMVRQDRWEEIRRFVGCPTSTFAIAEIARRLDVDRKTVRRCLRQERWQAYRRVAQAETLLARHTDFIRERAPQLRYSARILFQELSSQHGYTGSYHTVKRFVRPLRTEQRSTRSRSDDSRRRQVCKARSIGARRACTSAPGRTSCTSSC